MQKIPLAFVEILSKTGVDFTLLGGEEWCCGFPLIGAGMKKEAEVLIQHNLETVKDKGVEKVVFACPSCYHTWMEEYKTDIKIFHSTQFIKQLIDEGKIQFKEKEDQESPTTTPATSGGRAEFMKPQEKSSGPSRAWNWWRWQITESSASVVEEGEIWRW